MIATIILLVIIMIIWLYIVIFLLNKIKNLKLKSLNNYEKYIEYKNKHKYLLTKIYNLNIESKNNKVTYNITKKKYDNLLNITNCISLRGLSNDYTTICNIIYKHKGVLEGKKWTYKISLTLVDFFVIIWLITKRTVKLKWEKWQSLRISITKKWKEFKELISRVW